jgi:hypothetical protein
MFLCEAFACTVTPPSLRKITDRKQKCLSPNRADVCFLSGTLFFLPHHYHRHASKGNQHDPGDHPGKGDPHRQSMKAFFVEAKRV